MKSLQQLGYQPLIPVTANDFANADKRMDWIKTRNMQVLSLQSIQSHETTIDIFVTEPFDFDNEYQVSAIADLTSTITFNIVSIHTLINMKKEAGRAIDLDDIEHLKIILKEENEHKT